MQRNFAAEIGQGERRLAIAAIHGAEQGEERLVLVDGEELTVALRPPLGGEIETHDAQFRHKGRTHSTSFNR